MTTKEERLKALNNMLEESFDITKVYDDSRSAVLSEIISEIENDEMKNLRARNYALSSQILSMINDNLEITETERVTKNFDLCTKSIQEEGAQTETISLAIISQSLIEIAKELAIMNDRSIQNGNQDD